MTTYLREIEEGGRLAGFTGGAASGATCLLVYTTTASLALAAVAGLFVSGLVGVVFAARAKSRMRGMTPRDVLKEDIKDFQMVDRIHMATEMSASVDTQGGMFEEEYRWPLCNTHAMSPSMTHVPKYVNCKNCLRRMRKA